MHRTTPALIILATLTVAAVTLATVPGSSGVTTATPELSAELSDRPTAVAAVTPAPVAESSGVTTATPNPWAKLCDGPFEMRLALDSGTVLLINLSRPDLAAGQGGARYKTVTANSGVLTVRDREFTTQHMAVAAINATFPARDPTTGGWTTRSRVIGGREWELDFVGETPIVPRRFPSRSACLVLSPAGEKLAISDDAETGIWVLDLAGGTEPVRVTSPPDYTVFPEHMFMPSPEGVYPTISWASSPWWSPDGKVIYFVSSRKGQEGLWTVPSDGGNPESCVVSIQGRPLFLLGVTATGRLLASSSAGLVLVDPRDGSIIRETTIRTVNVWWSPDKTRAVASDIRSGLWVLDENGGTEQIAGPGEGYVAAAYSGAWSPDGHYFAIYMSRFGLDASGNRDCLLTVFDLTATPARIAHAMRPPPGLWLDEHVLMGWVGLSHLVMVLRGPGWTGSPETWAWAVPEE